MNTELKTLISLLDDNDRVVQKAVTTALLKKGLEVIPQLEKVWESTSDSATQERIEGIIHYIQFDNTKKNLKYWIKNGADNLLEGVIYVAQIQYPGLKLEHVNKEIEKLSQDVYLSAGNHLTAIEKVKLLNYVFFELNNFSRNSTNLYTPQNSFINNVLQTRKGNPISLGILYLVIANKVGLPVYGVNLPKSFVLAYLNEFRHTNDIDPANDILFYINPYNKGAILNRKEIDLFIEQHKIKPKQEYFAPCDNVAIIQQLIASLMISYEKMGFKEKLTPLKALLDEVRSYKGSIDF